MIQELWNPTVADLLVSALPAINCLAVLLWAAAVSIWLIAASCVICSRQY
jgi:hypothetical protein